MYNSEKVPSGPFGFTLLKAKIWKEKEKEKCGMGWEAQIVSASLSNQPPTIPPPINANDNKIQEAGHVPIPTCTLNPGGDERGIEKEILFYLREVVIERGKR